jgi:hypothetical protein
MDCASHSITEMEQRSSHQLWLHKNLWYHTARYRTGDRNGTADHPYYFDASQCETEWAAYEPIYSDAIQFGESVHRRWLHRKLWYHTARYRTVDRNGRSHQRVFIFENEIVRILWYHTARYRTRDLVRFHHHGRSYQRVFVSEDEIVRMVLDLLERKVLVFLNRMERWLRLALLGLALLLPILHNLRVTFLSRRVEVVFIALHQDHLQGRGHLSSTFQKRSNHF